MYTMCHFPVNPTVSCQPDIDRPSNIQKLTITAGLLLSRFKSTSKMGV